MLPARACTASATRLAALVLLQHDLEPDAFGLDVASPKAAFGDDALELIGGVGAVSEPGKNAPRYECAPDPELLAVHLSVDFGAGRFLAPGLDYGPPPPAQTSEHTADGA